MNWRQGSREGTTRGGFERFGNRRGGHRDRSSRFERFFRRMDTNGDGIIREDEIPENRRGMYRMMSMRFGMDPSKGISIKKLRETMSAMRGRGNNGSPPGQGTSSGKPNKPKQPEEDPLVPGFGSDREPQPVLGFGVRAKPVDMVAQSNQVPGRRDGFSRRHDNRQREEDREETSSDETRPGSYRFRSAHERLPEGLPDWFVSRDFNMDGQVAMAEYARHWTRSTLEEYFKYDANRDGVITPEECLSPGEGIAGIKAPLASPAPPAVRPTSTPAAKPKEELPYWLRYK